MTIAFPLLPGRAWPVRKKIIWNNRVAEHASGRRIVSSLWRYPLYEFSLTHEALSTSEQFQGVAAHSWQIITDFYNQLRGQYETFYFTDLSDTQVVGEALGVGDGVTTDFVMTRTLVTHKEPVGHVLSVTQVQLNTVVQPDGWQLVLPNILRFDYPPAVGQVVMASFNFAYLCRLLEDPLSTSQLQNSLWETEELMFRSERV